MKRTFTGQLATPPEREVLTSQEAADYLRVSTRTLWKWVQPRGPIPVYVVENSHRYLRSDLLAFLHAHQLRPESVPAKELPWTGDQPSSSAGGTVRPVSARRTSPIARTRPQREPGVRGKDGQKPGPHSISTADRRQSAGFTEGENS